MLAVPTMIYQDRLSIIPQVHGPRWFCRFLLLSLFFLPVRNGAQAGTTEAIAWQRLETRYTIIHYQCLKDLAKFCATVKCDPNDWGVKVLLNGRPSVIIKDIVAQKTDGLFEKVQAMLGMRKKINKINISIYNNKEQLHEAYARLFQEECSIRAWYYHGNNMVSVNIHDLDESVLAHELAHAIVDHYLLVRPPRPTAEIIARYIGSNIKRTVRSYSFSERPLSLAH